MKKLSIFILILFLAVNMAQAAGTGPEEKASGVNAAQGTVPEDLKMPDRDPGGKFKPVDFTGETIYFLMIDRFFDGNRANDKPEKLFSPDRSAGTLYYGGDIRGIIDRLDYIKELGTTALWITPVVKNTQDLYHYGDKTMASYHGYWGMDFWEINPQFGTMEDFKELVSSCHNRGIRLILDIVLNHTSPAGQGCDGAIYEKGKFIADYSNDPFKWFHHNGTVDFSEDTHENWFTRNLFDLADLNQDNPDVDKYLEGAALFWLDTGIDGFRVDTARFMSVEWLKSFSDRIQAHRKVFIFGEWSEGGPDVPRAVDFENKSDMAILDFGFQRAVTKALAGRGSMKEIAKIMALDSRFRDPLNRVLFIDNHDMPRFLSRAIASGLSEKEAIQRLEMAVTLMITSRGVPCIYYGTEQYLHDETKTEWGTGGEPYNRQMMTSFDKRTLLFNQIRQLSSLRRYSAAVRKGSQSTLKLSHNIYVYERKLGGEVVLVALNKGKERVVEFNNLSLPDGSYQKIMSCLGAAEEGQRTANICIAGEEIEVSGGKAKIRLPENSSGVWIYRDLGALDLL
ncbi:MAG: alpha-amylase family glycosyl hydrolase [Chloroflexi bacterium]|nr:alpha-amylase family glycosyl hydrolase [Chloroflexota bacterium]